MKILLIGSGGREHALAWSISDSPLTQKLVIAPGNPGMAPYGELVNIKAHDIQAICDYAKKMAADLVVIGPEVPLVMGLVDKLNAQNIPAFGPNAAAARLEGSKEFARMFCKRHGIPQPDFFSAEDYATACKQIDSLNGCVIKADGLAAGKGVFIAESKSQAKQAAKSMLEGQFGIASSRLVIEERINGSEASLFALVDGEQAILMATAQDYKRAFDGNMGPNTGGMGAISPAPNLSPELEKQIMNEVVFPVVRGMALEGTPYHGVLYVGLMLTETGPQVIEFNCRLGDPEAQVILPRLRTDIVSAMLATTTNSLGHFDMRWDNQIAVTVVMANKGYPESHSSGSIIKNIRFADNQTDQLVFHAGTKIDAGGQLIASGGRVLSVTGLGDTLEQARKTAYDAVQQVEWPESFFRSDIAGM